MESNAASRSQSQETAGRAKTSAPALDDAAEQLLMFLSPLIGYLSQEYLYLKEN